MWRKNAGLAAGIKTYFEVTYYPAFANRFLKPDIQFIIMIVLGILQILPIMSLGLISLLSKDYWFKLLLKKVFFNRYFSWYIYLLVEIQLNIFNDALKCSQTFGLVLIWSDTKSEKPSICESSFGIGIHDAIWVILSTVFLACTLINVWIYIGLSENTRIRFEYLT